MYITHIHILISIYYYYDYFTIHLDICVIMLAIGSMRVYEVTIGTYYPIEKCF